MFKHQSNCYRTIKGIRYINYIDLCFNEEKNKEIIKGAKKKFKRVRVMQRDKDLKAVFVAY